MPTLNRRQFLKLAAALEAAGAREQFDALAYSHRKEHVRSVTDAKKAETRARRIANVVTKLGAGATT